MAHHCLDTHSIGIARGRLEDQTVDLQHTSGALGHGRLEVDIGAVRLREGAGQVNRATRTSSAWPDENTAGSRRQTNMEL